MFSVLQPFSFLLVVIIGLQYDLGSASSNLTTCKHLLLGFILQIHFEIRHLFRHETGGLFPPIVRKNMTEDPCVSETLTTDPKANVSSACQCPNA